MSNILRFRKSMLSSGNTEPEGTSGDAEISLLADVDNEAHSARRDVRDIILFLELAAFQLRRAGALKPNPDLREKFKGYLASAEELIEMTRRKAPGL
jgi:hypothetical protein